MELDLQNAENNLGSLVNKLTSEKNHSNEISNDAQPLDDINCLDHQTTDEVKNIDSSLLEKIIPSKDWWYEIKHLVIFVLLVALVVFVVCKCFDILERYSGVPSEQISSYYCVPCCCDLLWRVPLRCAPFSCRVSSNDVSSSGFLWVLFGIISLLFIGIVVVAIFLIKSSKAYYVDRNEKENKAFAFALKMMETKFELDNRKIIAEKNCMEKVQSIKDKKYMYSMDEKQCSANHERKMQLRQYELVENYMNHITEIEKQRIIGKQSD